MEPIISAEPSTRPPIVLYEKGNTMQTKLTDQFCLNNDSTLQREFVSVIDNTLPARLTSCVGVKTIYETNPDPSLHGYFYHTKFAVCAVEPIVAFQVRFELFNVWGAHVRTVDSSQIADISIESIYQCETRWHIDFEVEAKEHFASIAYVATVRTNKGQILNADKRPIIEAARNITNQSCNATFSQITL